MEVNGQDGSYAVGHDRWADAEVKLYDISYLLSDSNKLNSHIERAKDVPTRTATKVNKFHQKKNKPRNNRTKGSTISELNQERTEMDGMSPVNRNLKKALLKLELEMIKKVLRSQNINVKQLVESKVAEASAKVGHLSDGAELRLDVDGIIKARTFAYQKEYDRELDNTEMVTVLRNELSSEKCVVARNIRNSVPRMELKETIALLKPHMTDMTGGQKDEVYGVSCWELVLHLFFHMLTILSLYSYQLLMKRFQLAEYVVEKDQIFLLKKSDARCRIKDYVRNSGNERLSNEVDDNGDDVQMTADELAGYTRVFISNQPASTEVKHFANDNCEEFFSVSTNTERKGAIRDVSESIYLTV